MQARGLHVGAPENAQGQREVVRIGLHDRVEHRRVVHRVLRARQLRVLLGQPPQTRNGERESDEAILKRLIERHFKHTGSTRARNLLDDWANSRGKFVKVFPTDYKRALEEMHNSSMEEANDKVEAVA